MRPVADADLDAVTDIYAYHVVNGTGTFELTPPTRAEMAQRVTALTTTGFPFLVAVEGSQVLGFAYVGPYRPRPAYDRTVEDSIYLSPDATGRGVGTALLTELLRRSEAMGVRQVIAVIGDSSNRASIRIHDKCGFAHVGTFRDVGWKHNRWLDTVLMQRSLGRGATTPPE